MEYNQINYIIYVSLSVLNFYYLFLLFIFLYLIISIYLPLSYLFYCLSLKIPNFKKNLKYTWNFPLLIRFKFLIFVFNIKTKTSEKLK